MNAKYSQLQKHSCDVCLISFYSVLKGDLKEIACSFCDTVISASQILQSPIEQVKSKCLIITMSFGELNPIDYSNTSILHVGISDSKSIIYNFWYQYKKEKASDKKIWKYVINIPLLNLSEELTLDDYLFDLALESSLDNQTKTDPHYDQYDNNCYSFACRFLNSINYFNKTDWSKENLALSLIEPYILILDKYSAICKKINDGHVNKEGFYEVSVAEDNKEMSYSVCDLCNEYIPKDNRYRCQVCPDYDLCGPCFNSAGHEHEMKKN